MFLIRLIFQFLRMKFVIHFVLLCSLLTSNLFVHSSETTAPGITLTEDKDTQLQTHLSQLPDVNAKNYYNENVNQAFRLFRPNLETDDEKLKKKYGVEFLPTLIAKQYLSGLEHDIIGTNSRPKRDGGAIRFDEAQPLHGKSSTSHSQAQSISLNFGPIGASFSSSNSASHSHGNDFGGFGSGGSASQASSNAGSFGGSPFGGSGSNAAAQAGSSGAGFGPPPYHGSGHYGGYPGFGQYPNHGHGGFNPGGGPGNYGYGYQGQGYGYNPYGNGHYGGGGNYGHYPGGGNGYYPNGGQGPYPHGGDYGPSYHNHYPSGGLYGGGPAGHYPGAYNGYGRGAQLSRTAKKD